LTPGGAGSSNCQSPSPSRISEPNCSVAQDQAASSGSIRLVSQDFEIRQSPIKSPLQRTERDRIGWQKRISLD
jgi:hypothetical protein